LGLGTTVHNIESVMISLTLKNAAKKDMKVGNWDGRRLTWTKKGKSDEVDEPEATSGGGGEGYSRAYGGTRRKLKKGQNRKDDGAKKRSENTAEKKEGIGDQGD